MRKSIVVSLIVVAMLIALSGCLNSVRSGNNDGKEKYSPPLLEEMQKKQDFSVRLPAYIPRGYSARNATINEDNSIEVRFGNDATMGIIKLEEWKKDSDWLEGYEGEGFEIKGGIAKLVSDEHLAGYLNETKLGFSLVSLTPANSAKLSKDELIKMADSMTCGNNATDALETQINCCIDVGCEGSGKCTNNECIAG